MIKKQLKNNGFDKSLDASKGVVEGGMKTTLVMSAVMNIFLPAVLNQMLSALRSLQIITHIQMLNINLPANVLLVMSILLPIT